MRRFEKRKYEEKQESERVITNARRPGSIPKRRRIRSMPRNVSRGRTLGSEMGVGSHLMMGGGEGKKNAKERRRGE